MTVSVDLKPTFKEEIAAEPGGEVVELCFSCGTCVAACPIRWVDDKYNPRRLIKMAVLGMRLEVLSSPLIWLCSECDLCYRRCPKGIRISDLMNAFRSIAAREGYEPERTVAHVNEWVCSGCGLCAEVCPYTAIDMTHSWRWSGKRISLPTVDKLLCHACGTCVATCPSSAIGLSTSSDVNIFDQIRKTAAEMG
jgi:heterodisulfide reductase subunit C